jgi:hypothetical protein
MQQCNPSFFTERRFNSGAIVQKQVQRHIAEGERSAFGLPLTGPISSIFENAKQAMTIITSNQQASTITAQAAAFVGRLGHFGDCLAALCPAFVYSINRHESRPMFRECGFDRLDWERGYSIRGGVPWSQMDNP